MTRLKHVAVLRAGGTPAVEDPSNWSDDGLPWVTISDMTRDHVVSTTERRVSETGMATARLPVGQRGTVLFAMYASVGATAVLGERAAWNQAILGITPRADRAYAPFVRYWLEHLRPQLPVLYRSNTQDNLNAEQVKNLPFPDMPVRAQELVARALDAETARIDALIEKKQLMLDLLEHRRTSVVRDGVEGRFTARGERRETSVPWMRGRPVRWREARLTLVARLGSGHTPSRDHPEWWEGCTIPWITTGEVAQMRSDRTEFITETREMISELGLANSAARLHPAGTVVLCRTASAGYSAIMGRDMATSQDFATWTCGPLLRPRFLLLCLRAMRQDLLGRLAMGSTHQTIYMPDIEAIRIPLPPVDEQDLIVQEVWTRLTGADAAADSLVRQIDILNERRQALITDAVTGERDLEAEAA